MSNAESSLVHDDINIAYPGAVGSWVVPLLIGQKHGIFMEHGICAQVVPVLGAAVPHLSDEVPFGYIGTPAALLLAAAGVSLRILGSFDSGLISGQLIARSEIDEPGALGGKRIGVRVIGAARWIQTILALEHLALEPQRDNINIVPVGDETQIVRALEAGTIDAALVSPAQSLQLRAQNFSLLLDMHAASVLGPQNALVVTLTYLQHHPDVVEKVVTALVDSIAFSRAAENKPRVVQTIMQLFNLSDPEAAEKGYESLIDLPPTSYASIERLNSMQEIMARHDPNLLNVRIQELIDNRFVRSLEVGV